MKGPARIRAVLFDLGGTLLDFRDPVAWANDALKVGIDVEADHLLHAFDEVEREADRPDDRTEVEEFWRRVLSQAASRDVGPGVAERFYQLQLENPPPGQLFSDARRCLETLKREGRRLGVISNSRSEESIRGDMRAAGILPYFRVVLSSGTEGVAKPSAELFHRGVARIGTTLAESVYVGNLAFTDAESARVAGLHSVWLNRHGTGLNDGPPEITSLLELPTFIRALENGAADRWVPT